MASKKKEDSESEVKEEIVLTDISVADTSTEADCWAAYKLSMQIDMNTTLHKLIELLGAGMLITITMLDGKRKRFLLVDVEEETNKGGC